MERRTLVLLEELKVQNQTQILLLQQLVSSQSSRMDTTDVEDEFGLPLTSLQQILKLETDCVDRDVKAKLVSIKVVLCKTFATVILF